MKLADTDNAWEARRIESAVAATGLPEVVHDATKRRLLGEPFVAARAQETLQDRAADLRRRLDLRAPEEPLPDLSTAHLGGSPVRLPLIDLTDHAPFRVSGRVVGFVGKVLIVEQRGLHFAASLAKVLAHVVEIRKTELSNPMPPGSGQLSLLG